MGSFPQAIPYPQSAQTPFKESRILMNRNILNKIIIPDYVPPPFVFYFKPNLNLQGYNNGIGGYQNKIYDRH